jgi:hypothetical protein
MEIKIEKIEVTEIYTRLLVTYEGREYIFDISSTVPEYDIQRMAEYYITNISR